MTNFWRSFWTTRRLLTAAFLLWPVLTFLIDFLGMFGLNRLTTSNDFGLASFDVVAPVAFAGGVALIVAALRRADLISSHFVLRGGFLVLVYGFTFLVWTFVAFPFGRINPNF